MTLAADNARSILRAALDADLGVGIIVDVEAMGEMIQPATRAKQILYRFKQEDHDFRDLAIKFDKYEPDKALRVYRISADARIRAKLGASPPYDEPEP